MSLIAALLLKIVTTSSFASDPGLFLKIGLRPSELVFHTFDEPRLRVHPFRVALFWAPFLMSSRCLSDP